MASIIGQSLGRYHILEQLGEGGMATVFKGYDTRLERDVAVKVIRTDQFAPAMLERILKRFDREAKVLAKLSHPNIVGVIDFGEYQGEPYLVMEYLPGGTLKQYLGKPMPWREAARMLLPVARALDFAHRQGMAHRDVKPSNILITADGDPMLTDFGIAKILDAAEGNTLTGTGVGVGTPEYMAPEQWVGEAGASADIYSLGVIFYEMIIGRKPYTADTPAAVLIKQTNDPLPRPTQFVRNLPEEVEKVLLKAMAKKPEDRYRSMGEFANVLNGLLTTKSSLPGEVKQAGNYGSKIGAIQAIGKKKEVEVSFSQETTRDEYAEDAEPLPGTAPAIPKPHKNTWQGKLPGSVKRWMPLGIALVALVIIVPLGLFLFKPGSHTPAETPASVAATEPLTSFAPTEALVSIAPTEIPTPITNRHGGWLEEIDYSIVDASSVVTQIRAGAINLFSYGLTSDKLQEIKDAGLCYTSSYGNYYGFIFNPAVFTNTTQLNPFSDHKIREAMNWAVDRDFINQEIYTGGALPKYLPLTTQLVDYTSVIDVARSLQAKYAYNLDKAQEVVDTEMAAMGATKGSDGKWRYKDALVTLIFLIRNDGDGTRLPQGEYFAQQLEALGFTVDRHLGKSSELSPLWMESNPKDGSWSVYTAGWGSDGLNRDEKGIFQEMYLPSTVLGIPLFLDNVVDPTFQQLGDDLANGNFTTLEQRREMITQALSLALQDSLQVWTVDTQNFAPFNCTLQVSADVGAGVETTKMSPLNLRYKDQEGEQLKVGTTDTMFTDPWNPVNGSNWVTSAFIQNAVSSQAFMPDPYTGLSWPWRAESADVTVKTGLPVGKSLDWVTLNFANQIDVPADAWGDWDATKQTFIPVGDGVTANTKVVIHYPADLFQTIMWHESTYLSVADFIMGWIELFDEGKPESAIYDEDVVPNLEAFMSHFKGIQIESTDPFTIAIYDDGIYSDAELIVSSQPASVFLWPQYRYGEAPWEAIAIGNMADAKGELAWGTGKAGRNSVEWTSFIGGPSLDILANDLDQAIADNTIPYAPTLGQYITADQAAFRYSSLKKWYASVGHFWSGTGPYYLASVDLNAGSAIVRNNIHYPDTADRWSNFGEAPLGTVELDGPSQVKIGDAVEFTATFSYKASGKPFPSADIKEVKFLIYDAKGATVHIGQGSTTGMDGVFTINVPASATSKLEAGSGRIEVAGVFIPVAIPAFTSLDFVTTP